MSLNGGTGTATWGSNAYPGGVQCGMANHLEEFACEVCGKPYRIGWSIPKDHPSFNEVAVTISHCPLGKALLAAGVISFEELLDGQW